MGKYPITPDKKLAAVCGLFCPACTIFMTNDKDLEKKKKIAKSLKVPVESVKCEGCRSNNRFIYCKTCKMVACAEKKGLDFCGECDEYPCAELKAFQSAMPHRIELWEAQARIKDVGYEKWFCEMLEHYECPECGMINSAYNLSCKNCGSNPSCSYVKLHKIKICDHLFDRSE